MFGLTQLESILAGVAVLLLGFLVWSAHERSIGEAQIKAADAAALVVARKNADAKTAELQQQVTAAQQEAQSEKAKTDAYIASHPIGVVRVCVAPRSGNGVSKAPASAGGVKSPGTGPAAVSQVSPGVDIGPGLSTLVQSAARLAELLAEAQHYAEAVGP